MQMHPLIIAATSVADDVVGLRFVWSVNVLLLAEPHHSMSVNCLLLPVNNEHELLAYAYLSTSYEHFTLMKRQSFNLKFVNSVWNISIRSRSNLFQLSENYSVEILCLGHSLLLLLLTPCVRPRARVTDVKMMRSFADQWQTRWCVLAASSSRPSDARVYQIYFQYRYCTNLSKRRSTSNSFDFWRIVCNRWR